MWLLVQIMWPVNAGVLQLESQVMQAYELCCVVFNCFFFSYPQFYPISTSLETYLSSLNHLVCWTTQGLGWIWGLNLYKQTLWNKTSICDELTRFPRIWWCFANQFLMLLFLLWLALIQTERSLPEWNKMLYFALRVNAAEQEMLLSRHAVFLSEITQIWLCLPSLCLARQIKY